MAGGSFPTCNAAQTPAAITISGGVRISANVTDDFGNVTGLGGRC
jgi:hypothetical protein